MERLGARRLSSAPRAADLADRGTQTDVEQTFAADHSMRAGGTRMRYAAFISYSHAADSEVAAALQSGLSRLTENQRRTGVHPRFWCSRVGWHVGRPGATWDGSIRRSDFPHCRTVCRR